MVILYVKFQSEKSCNIYSDVHERSCIFNNEIVFLAI